VCSQYLQTSRRISQREPERKRPNHARALDRGKSSFVRAASGGRGRGSRREGVRHSGRRTVDFSLPPPRRPQGCPSIHAIPKFSWACRAFSRSFRLQPSHVVSKPGPQCPREEHWDVRDSRVILSCGRRETRASSCRARPAAARISSPSTPPHHHRGCPEPDLEAGSWLSHGISSPVQVSMFP
jgi:hypothetical protein